jgi:F-type H+-transporting ATPase subunit b
MIMTKNLKNQLNTIALALVAFWTTQACADAANEPGLPQLDISTWPSQMFWLVVLFGAGYLIMAKVVTPSIGAVLEERRIKLDGDLEKARTASSGAAKIRADYESDLEKARSEASKFAKQAAIEASKEAADAEAKVGQKLADRIAKAESNLAKAKSNVMGNLNDVAVEAAIDAIDALTGIKTTSAQASKAVTSIATKLNRQEAN